MGSVWRVKDDGGTVYAMKILRDSLVDEEQSVQQGQNPADPSTPGSTSEGVATARERLRREAAALRRVNHPGVCQIVDMELDDSLAFIVTELIEGKNLREDVATNGRYVGEDLARLARKLIDAVSAVHHAGIIHRDIKPTNVMISHTGPVLVDFGIAMGEGESHVTRTGLVMGTPGFIAPEIIDGAESDEATDWWSVASVLAFAATGRPVFGSKPMMAVLEREASGHADLSGLPQHVTEALRSALSPHRDQRCTPMELLQAIEADALALELWSAAAQAPFGTQIIGKPSMQPDSAIQEHADQAPIPSIPPASPNDEPAASADHPEQSKEAMRPFGKNFSDSPASVSDNPRTLWDDEPSVVSLATAPEAMETVAIAHDDALPDTSPSAPAIHPANVQNAPSSSPAPNDSDTAFMMRTRTVYGSAMPSGTLYTPDDPPTQVVQEAPIPQPAPATQVLQTPLQASPPVDPARTAVMSDLPTTMAAPEFMPASFAPPMPINAPEKMPPPVTPPFAASSPEEIAANASEWYVSRGTSILLLLAIPICIFAAAVPSGACIAAAFMLWVFTASGLSHTAQLRRETKRGGMRRGMDNALIIGSLPWHLLKALFMILPPLALMTVLFTACTAFFAVALQLPRTSGIETPFSWDIPLPLIGGTPLSASGCMLCIAMAAAWLSGALGPYSHMARLGAGALRGDASASSTDTSQTNRRHWVLTFIWIVLILASIALVAYGSAIDWSPLPVTSAVL